MLLKALISSLIIVAVSPTCQGALIKRNTDCPVKDVVEHPQDTMATVGQKNVTLICSFNDSSVFVDWTQTLRNRTIMTFGITNLRNVSEFEALHRIKVASSTQKITFLTVRARHHGAYFCQIPNCETRSTSGFLRVRGPVDISFLDELSVYEAGRNVVITVLVFGYPDATMSLEKQGSDGIYRPITDTRFSLSSTKFTIDSVQLEDDGIYRIWGNNSEGNSFALLNLTVRGVPPPVITLSEHINTESQYRSLVVVNCSIQPSAHEEGLELYWAYANLTRLPVIGSVRQADSSDFTTTLTIDSFEEGDNGVYICFARNSNSEAKNNFTLIGPPMKMMAPDVFLSSGNIVIRWEVPNTFGSRIIKFIIQYEPENNTLGINKTEITVESTETSLLFDPPFCRGGQWKFRITAVNQYNVLGEYSNYASFLINDRCGSSSSLIVTTTTVFMSSSYVTVSTTMTSTSAVTTTPSLGITPTSDNLGTVSLPVVAGAAAGGIFALVVVIGLLTVAILCWIMSTKRASKRRALTHWRHSEEHVDHSNSTQSLPEKSPEPFFDIMVGIPSPLPATPGYGPVYIDPCYEFPREDLDLTDILYEGNFTVIYKAKASGIKDNKPIDVAVKSIKEEYFDMDDYVSTLVMEMEQLSQLEPHPNIVGLVRVCTVGRPVYMVMEYMCHGDLLGFLRATRGHSDMYTVFPGTKNIPTHVKLTSRDLLNIINQVANGMLFLSEQKIAHGALCARNVLVGTSMEVKIFNIGAHNLDNDINFESLARWMPPEVFVDGVRSTYGDVWSFGVLMWEVVTVGGTPYSDVHVDDLFTQLHSGMRLKRPNHCTQPVYDIMTSCWEAIPQHRPLFMEIVNALNTLNTSKMSYLDLRNYNETQYSQFDFTETPQMSVL